MILEGNMAGKVCLAFTVACALLLAACGGGATAGSPGAGELKSTLSSFTAELLPASLVGDARAGDLTLLSSADGDSTTVRIALCDAHDLTAVMIDITYDPALYSPITAECTAPLGDPGDYLELINTTDPGCVHIGRVLVNPGEQAGINGPVAAAEITFTHRAFPGSRAVSLAPTNIASAAILADTDAGEITWYHTCRGDYDQNGLVSAADLVPLAVFYGESVAPDLFEMDDVRSIVDGSQDGTISVNDITPIGQSFNNSILGGFNIYYSRDGGDYPESAGADNGEGAVQLGHVGLDETITENPAENRKQYVFTVGSPDADGYYWLRPRDELGNCGIPSSLLTELGVRAPRVDGAMAQARLDDSNNTLIWHYYNPGDNNLDGTVNISDIASIGDDLSRLGPFHPDTLAGMKDINHDQVINETDINLVQKHYGNTIAGYNVYASSNPVDYPESNGDPSAGYPVGKVMLSQWIETGGRPYLVYITGNPRLYHWVRPFDALGNEGTPCELQYPADPEAFAPTNATSAAVASWEEQTGYMWFFYNAGDYNQDGIVSASDLTPVGQHYGETGPFDPASAVDVIDGNHDETIDDNDMPIIGKYLANQIVGYNLYTSNDPDDYTFSSTSPSRTSEIAQLAMSEALGSIAVDRLHFEYLPPPGAIQYYFWVRPYDAEGNEGVPSNLVVIE